MVEPRAERPSMPGYGIDEGGSLLPWSWAVERLTTSHDFWLATNRAGRPPHVLPVWALWWEDALWFSAGPASRKARNLEADPTATMTTQDPTEPVVVEGTTERVDDHDRIVAFAAAYGAKYGGSYADVDFLLANACFRLVPAVVFGLVEAEFTSSPTRWTFPISLH